jgi:hypothetical protein
MTSWPVRLALALLVASAALQGSARPLHGSLPPVPAATAPALLLPDWQAFAHSHFLQPGPSGWLHLNTDSLAR